MAFLSIGHDQKLKKTCDFLPPKPYFCSKITATEEEQKIQTSYWITTFIMAFKVEEIKLIVAKVIPEVSYVNEFWNYLSEIDTWKTFWNVRKSLKSQVHM